MEREEYKGLATLPCVSAVSLSVFAPSTEKAETSPFLFLSLDLPTTPLFQVSPCSFCNCYLLLLLLSPQDELERNIIPQVPLFDLLSKFDGAHEKVSHLCDKEKWLPFENIHIHRSTRHTRSLS